MLLLEAVRDALAVVSPVACVGCGADDRAVCASCRRALLAGQHRRLVGDTLEVVSALHYEAEARNAILALKEHGRTDAAGPLGAALAVALRAAVRGAVEVVPVPSSRTALRRRGFDPVLVLLRRAGVRRPSRVLVRVRRTARQKTLDIESRKSNSAGSLGTRHPLTGRRFVLVDDVLTTGATLLEAARAVTAAGGEVVAAATLAATPRRSPHPVDELAGNGVRRGSVPWHA